MNYRDMLLEQYFNESGDPALVAHANRHGNISDDEYGDDVEEPINGHEIAASKKFGTKVRNFGRKVGGGALNVVAGKRDGKWSARNTVNAAAMGVGAAGAATGAVGLARLNKLKKDGHQMYLQAKAKGKVKDGESESEWIARQIKAAKIVAISGGAATLAGAGTRGGSAIYKGIKNKKAAAQATNEALAISFDYDEDLYNAYLECNFELEAMVYDLAMQETLDLAECQGYFDEGLEAVALMEAFNNADVCMLIMESFTDAPEIVKAQYINEAEDAAKGKKKKEHTPFHKTWAGKALTTAAGSRVTRTDENGNVTQYKRSAGRIAAINAGTAGAVAGAGVAGTAAVAFAKFKKNPQAMYKAAVAKGCKDDYETWYKKTKKKLIIAMAAGGAGAAAGIATHAIARHGKKQKLDQVDQWTKPVKQKNNDDAVKNESINEIENYNALLIESIYDLDNSYESYDEFDYDDYDLY